MYMLTKEERKRKYLLEHADAKDPYVEQELRALIEKELRSKGNLHELSLPPAVYHRYSIAKMKKAAIEKERHAQVRAAKEQKRLLKLAHRVNEISRHITAGKTLQEISLIFGVSRERIRQIIAANVPWLWEEEQARRRAKRRILVECSVGGCDKKVEMGVNSVRKPYCRDPHFPTGKNKKYATEEEKRLAINARNKWRYHNDPVRKKSVVEATKKYHSRKMATDPAYRQRQLQYQRDYVKKRMQDPAYREMKMQRWREKYYNNPEFREKTLAYGRKYSKEATQKRIKEQSEEMVNDVLSAAKNKGLL